MRLSNFMGNTPMIKISEKIYAKFEGYNPSGSIKDRMACYILNNAEDNGLIKKGDTIIEATSGNSGIAFAFLAAERGYKIKIVMPSNMSDERKKILKLYGAELIEVGAGKFDEAIQLRDELSDKYGYFNPNQFHNTLNIEAHYKTTGPEIFSQIDGKIGAFVSGTGTGGTIMGTTKFLKEKYPNMKSIAVEPAESPVMSGGEPGLHGIQGIGDGSKFLVDLNEIDDIMVISTKDASERATKLSKEMGLFVGISSGANILACERYLESNDIDGVMVSILCDRGDKYLSCI